MQPAVELLAQIQARSLGPPAFQVFKDHGGGSAFAGERHNGVRDCLCRCLVEPLDALEKHTTGHFTQFSWTHELRGGLVFTQGAKGLLSGLTDFCGGSVEKVVVSRGSDRPQRSHRANRIDNCTGTSSALANIGGLLVRLERMPAGLPATVVGQVGAHRTKGCVDRDPAQVAGELGEHPVDERVARRGVVGREVEHVLDVKQRVLEFVELRKVAVRTSRDIQYVHIIH